MNRAHHQQPYRRDGTARLMAPRMVALYLLLAFGATLVVNAMGTFRNPDDYRVLDWAISYADGFVRRGLPGDVFSRLHDAFGWPILSQIFAVKTALYGLFFLAVYLLLRAARFSHAAVLLLYSPFFVMFQLTERAAAGRKEIMFLAAFAVLCVSVARASTNRQVRLAFVLFALVAPVIVLTHEANFFFLAWVPALAVALGVDRAGLLRLCLLGLPALIAMAFVAAYPAHDTTVATICASLEGRLGAPVLEADCLTTRNAVTWLNETSQTGFDLVVTHLPQMLPTLPPALILVGLAFLPFRPVIRRWPASERRNLGIACAIAVLASLPLFVVALDWGRFVYMHAVAFGLVMLVLVARRSDDSHSIEPGAPVTPAPAPLAHLPVIFVIVYFFGWSLNLLGVLVGGGFVIDLVARVIARS